MDYYALLEVKRQATPAEIAQAYRRLALKYHPSLKPQERALTVKHFSQVSEAFQVLSCPEKRAFYDKYGEYLLKKGIQTEDGIQGGYQFGGQPELVFQKFFGVDNPFAQLYDSAKSLQAQSVFSYSYKASSQQYLNKIENLQVPLQCSLEQLFYGCIKKVTYTKLTLEKDGRNVKQQTITRDVEVVAGTGQGQKIVFKEQGHQKTGCTPSDLILVINLLPHPQFTRQGSTLFTTVEIGLKQALLSQSVVVSTIQKKEVIVSFKEVINPKTTIVLQGSGMPTRGGRGDLVVRFKIKIPQKLTFDKKQELIKLLS